MERLNVAMHPELASLYLGHVSLTWTRHATAQAKVKAVPVSWTLHVPKGAVVEAEREASGKPATKLVVRVSLTPSLDQVLVLVPKGSRQFTVLTCWLNRRDDTHQTLKAERITPNAAI